MISPARLMNSQKVVIFAKAGLRLIENPVLSSRSGFPIKDFGNDSHEKDFLQCCQLTKRGVVSSPSINFIKSIPTSFTSHRPLPKRGMISLYENQGKGEISNDDTRAIKDSFSGVRSFPLAY
jgi:hypothetical protein